MLSDFYSNLQLSSGGPGCHIMSGGQILNKFKFTFIKYNLICL